MTAIPLTGLAGQWHMLSSLETITRQETLILMMMSIGPSDHQVGQGWRAADKCKGSQFPPSALVLTMVQPLLCLHAQVGDSSTFFWFLLSEMRANPALLVK